MNVMISMAPAIIFGVFFLCIPLFIGVYVWQDAKRRRMPPLLWTLVAALAPGLIGLIVYLLVRGKYRDLECPNCGESVGEEFTVCPGCGTKLRPSCPGCGAGVESGWKVCPICGKALPERQVDVQPPQRRKDKSLKVVLAVVILIPLLLIVMMLMSVSVYDSVGGISSAAELPMDYYLELQEPEARRQVEQWYEGLQPEQGCGYILYRENSVQEGYEFLVYVPGAGGQVHTSFGTQSGIFGTVLKMELEKTGEDGHVFVVYSSGKELPKLKILLDGEKIPVELQKVDFPIAVNENE